jgi:hypothetical protein
MSPWSGIYNETVDGILEDNKKHIGHIFLSYVFLTAVVSVNNMAYEHEMFIKQLI